MPLEVFSQGDEVAILPELDSPPADVVELAEVANADDVTVQLADGRMYSRQHRWGLTSGARGYLVHATDEHFRILRAR